MDRSLALPEGPVPYRVRRSPRARRVSVTVYPGGALIVTLPLRVAETAAEGFLRKKAAWIWRALLRLRRLAPAAPRVRRPRAEYLEHKERARALVTAKLAAFNAAYGFAYRRIAIKRLKSRWGSCSRKGNLNFSYRLALIPEPLADYVIVHELCHLGEFNHSPAFWALVARTIPDYRERKRALAAYHPS